MQMDFEFTLKLVPFVGSTEAAYAGSACWTGWTEEPKRFLDSSFPSGRLGMTTAKLRSSQVKPVLLELLQNLWKLCESLRFL